MYIMSPLASLPLLVLAPFLFELRAWILYWVLPPDTLLRRSSAVASALFPAEGGFPGVPPRSFLQHFGNKSQSNVSTGRETHAGLDRVTDFSDSPHTLLPGSGVPLTLPSAS